MDNEFILSGRLERMLVYCGEKWHAIPLTPPPECRSVTLRMSYDIPAFVSYDCVAREEPPEKESDDGEGRTSEGG